MRGTALSGGSDKGVLFISVKDAVMHFRQDDQKQNLSFVFAGWKNPFTTELCFQKENRFCFLEYIARPCAVFHKLEIYQWQKIPAGNLQYV